MKLTRNTVLLVASLLGPGACSREVPVNPPETSPASLSAAEVAPARVTRALEGEPPLPGEPAGDWPGLESNAAPSGHEHHHHPAPEAPTGHEHHQHAAPAAQPSAPPVASGHEHPPPPAPAAPAAPPAPSAPPKPSGHEHH